LQKAKEVPAVSTLILYASFLILHQNSKSQPNNFQ